MPGGGGRGCRWSWFGVPLDGSRVDNAVILMGASGLLVGWIVWVSRAVAQQKLFVWVGT